MNKDTVLCMSLAARPGNFGIRFHNYLYEKLSLNFIYKSFTTTNLEDAVRGIRALGIRGSAISMPFKTEVMKYLNTIQPSALRIGAVNTIVNAEGHLSGHNTDYTAICELLKKYDVSKIFRVGILGSGGIAKAIACALHDLNFLNVTVISRNQMTGAALAKNYGFKWRAEPGQEFFDILINATPLGMAPHTEDIPFSDELLVNSTYVIDAVATPPETSLIKRAKFFNKQAITGHDITVLQAKEQFKLYTGVMPPTELVTLAANYASG